MGLPVARSTMCLASWLVSESLLLDRLGIMGKSSLIDFLGQEGILILQYEVFKYLGSDFKLTHYLMSNSRQI